MLVEHSGYQQKGCGKPLFQARLIIKRKDAGAAERSLRAARQGHQRRRRNQTMLPTTVAAAEFVVVLTSIPATDMTAEAVLDLYRLRWQIEIAFKRLKSGLGIHKLPAKDPQLARTWLTAHLIPALMIDEAVSDALDCSPAPGKAIAISMWRLHDLLRRALLAAILAALSQKKAVPRPLAKIMRLLCDTPRLRKSQSNVARTLEMPVS